VGILHGLDRVFRGKSPHYQGQLAVGSRLDGKPINAEHVLRGMSATVHFHDKFDIFHGSLRFFDLSYRWQWGGSAWVWSQKDPSLIGGIVTRTLPSNRRADNFQMANSEEPDE
jgi:hypothetical protein